MEKALGFECRLEKALGFEWHALWPITEGMKPTLFLPHGLAQFQGQMPLGHRIGGVCEMSKSRPGTDFAGIEPTPFRSGGAEQVEGRVPLVNGIWGLSGPFFTTEPQGIELMRLDPLVLSRSKVKCRLETAYGKWVVHSLAWNRVSVDATDAA